MIHENATLNSTRTRTRLELELDSTTCTAAAPSAAEPALHVLAHSPLLMPAAVLPPLQFTPLHLPLVVALAQSWKLPRCSSGLMTKHAGHPPPDRSSGLTASAVEALHLARCSSTRCDSAAQRRLTSRRTYFVQYSDLTQYGADAVTLSCLGRFGGNEFIHT